MPATATYYLKRFSSAADPDFAAALIVYVRNTPPAVRTDTNEITFWLEQFTKTFGDDFYVFGFYKDHELVGFAQAAYFVDERLIVLDYLAIEERHRGNNVFYEFADQLKRAVEVDHPEYRYAIAEVCYGPGQAHPTPAAALLIRLLKLQGFHVIRAAYFQPRMTLADAESEMRGDLLLYTNPPVETLRSETYMSIVSTLYYKHYLRWQRVVKQDKQDAYRAHLDELFQQVRRGVGQKRSIQVNGHKKLLDPPAPKKPVLTVHRIVIFSIQGLGVVFGLAAGMLGLKVALRLSNTTFAAAYMLALISFVAIASIVSVNARHVLRDLLSFVRDVTRSRRAIAEDDEPSEALQTTSETQPAAPRRLPSRKRGGGSDTK